MSWPSPHSILMVEQLRILIGSLRLQDTVGRIFEIQLKWLQLVSGLSTPVLEHKHVLSYLPSGWITALHHKLVHYNIQIRMTGVWIPEQQRDCDQVIMDFVTHKLPEWMWGPINKCRLYLEATTLTDITSFDGRYIPRQIYLVKDKLRQTTLRFPRTQRPSKTDQKQWQYFIRYITKDTLELLTPLTAWKRTPYQKYSYVWTPDTNLIYRQQQDKWAVYYHHENTRNKYGKANIVRGVLPKQWIPTNVIKKSEGDLLRIEQPESTLKPNESLPVFGRFEAADARAVVGQFEIDLRTFERIKQRWHEPDFRLVCGADGGLKDGIGSSGYTIYVEGESDRLVQGHSAELQPSTTASSTRQELLGQLAIEYWLEHMQEVLGEPNGKIKINLVTDSQASIEILKNLEWVIGIKAVLKADVDVGLAIFHKRKQTQWAQFTTTKVKSHIAMADAPDDLCWLVNEEADGLAIEAREKVGSKEMEARSPCLLPGTRAGCVIGDTMVTQNLKQQIQSQIHDSTLSQYLCEKYSWSERIFSDIDWIAHEQAVSTLPLLQRVTIIKYIHGWLATKSRRYRDGAFFQPPLSTVFPRRRTFEYLSVPPSQDGGV